MGFETCGPNEVMVVSGCCLARPVFVQDSCRFVWPGIQKLQRLSLNTHTLTIDSNNVYTQSGVAISVTGIAQVKIVGSNEEMLQMACELFLGKSEREVQAVVQETFKGHQDATVSKMTVEEIYDDRKKFSQAVFEVASCDFINMGMYVVSYTLKDMRDEEGYIKSLVARRAEQVKIDELIERQAIGNTEIKDGVSSVGTLGSQTCYNTSVRLCPRRGKTQWTRQS